MTQTYRDTALLYLADRPLTPVVQVMLRCVVAFVKWEERRRSRQQLRDLDQHMLDDIGLTRHQADREAARPFWMP
jgi:uncharacterized protein YjiS (DUF1127 family)